MNILDFTRERSQMCITGASVSGETSIFYCMPTEIRNKQSGRNCQPNYEYNFVILLILAANLEQVCCIIKEQHKN